MAAFENSIIIFLMLSRFIINDSNASIIQSSNPVIEVPGLLVGSKISFFYYGNDLSRVTLSVEDTIGKILHLELRLNEGCTDNAAPEILLNTYTNGTLDANELINELPWLKERNVWHITAEEDGFLIEGRGGRRFEEKYTQKFPYILPHKLSDIRKIQMYADEGCGVGETNFIGYLRLSQTIPKGFTRVLFEGVQPTRTPFSFSITSGEERAHFTASLSTANQLLFDMFGNNGRNRVTSTIEYSQDNPIEVMIEKTSDSTYEATVWTSPENISSNQIKNMPAAEASGEIFLGFEKITKLEID